MNLYMVEEIGETYHALYKYLKDRNAWLYMMNDLGPNISVSLLGSKIKTKIEFEDDETAILWFKLGNY